MIIVTKIFQKTIEPAPIPSLYPSAPVDHFYEYPSEPTYYVVGPRRNVTNTATQVQTLQFEMRGFGSTIFLIVG
jgi:hypothetical protein